MAEHAVPALEVVVLAGGRGSRLGGESKADLLLGGARLLDRVCGAVAAQLPGVPITVVAPDTVMTRFRRVREEPPFAGPAAGLAAGLAGVRAEWVIALACDLENPVAALRALLGTEDGADGTVLTDPEGREQWLVGRYRRRAALAVLGEPDGLGLRATIGRLRLRRVAVPAPITADIDTPEALRRAREKYSHSPNHPDPRGLPV